MKIFYISVIEQNAGWGAEYFVNQGFKANGHSTYCLDYRKHRKHLAQEFLKDASDFDVLFLQRGDYFPIQLLKAVNRPKFLWASELVSRNRDQDRLLKSNLFEHVFVHSQKCKEIVINKKWIEPNRISVLINGFDINTQYKILNGKKDIDILHIGNILPRRRLWLDKLKEEYTIVAGNAYGRDMTELINRAKIVLNVHAEEYLDTETRVFEVLGCGSFLLSEKLSAENPFIPNIHYSECRDIADMLNKIGYYLSHETEREQIALAGHIEAIEKHYYRKRAKEIADVFAKYIKKNNLPAIESKKVQLFQLIQHFFNLGLKLSRKI